MSAQLSSIKFFNGVQPFTAEEHLQNKENILLKDGTQFIALNRITFLKGLMSRVHTIPVIQEETYETVEQTVCTTSYTTDMSFKSIQLTFAFDPSVFTNYSIFEFTEQEIFPSLNGIDYRLGNLRCYTIQSWSSNKPLKMLFIGSTPVHCHRPWQYNSDADSDEDNEDTYLVIPPIFIPEEKKQSEEFKEFDTPIFRSLTSENLDWPETY